MQHPMLPLTVYGSDISYFTGKLEMYLRAKGIPYTFEPMTGPTRWNEIKKATGVDQMPAVLAADGRWMTDTTPMIAWFEQEFPERPLVPTEPVQRFFSLLLEDYADEWLWRPAMHYRWYYDEGAMYASRHLANELLQELPLPGALKRHMLRRRQRGGYTRGDGVNESNRAHTEAAYLDNLERLESVLRQRPWLLGNSPSLADVAFMGPMFRHFSMDPNPAQIMRKSAPGVYEWIARLWNYPADGALGDWGDGVPADWDGWLQDIGRNYLPYLCANADAVAAGQSHFSPNVDGATYHKAIVSPYRVWTLGCLRAAYEALPPELKPDVQARLERCGCWEPLWRSALPDVDVNRDCTPPFGTNAKML